MHSNSPTVSQEALQLIANQKNVSQEYVIDTIIAAGGPSVNATQADAVRFYDDVSTYTGVATKGGRVYLAM